MTRTLSSEQLLRHFIGFNVTNANASSFPPHNIEKLSEYHYRLTLAVAGFAREDISMYVHQGTLTISGQKPEQGAPSDSFIYQGIAFRDWNRQFNLGEYIAVADAHMENGLLVIDLIREVPEELKPQPIKIR